MSTGPPLEKLLGEAERGEQRALVELITRYRDRLLSRIRLMLGPEARREAESRDFCQDVLVEALDNIEQFSFRGEKQFLRWLTTIARNTIIDAARKQRVESFESLSSILDRQEERFPDQEKTPSDEAALNERLLHLTEALEELREEHRIVIELRQFDRLRFEEIGSRIGRSPEAARKLHDRAMLRLGRMLRSH